MCAAFDIPLLMTAFNRPEKTRRVFEAIRAAAPRRLYVAVDGPRPGVASDVDRVERTRGIADEVDWPCTVERLCRPQNVGCKRGVETAIDWFLAAEESGILLEDDCVPTPDFFAFCADMLERYRDVPEVMMIGGHNPLGRWDAGSSSYVFSRTAPFHGGWATWRRAWARYDPAMTRWPDPRARAAVRARMEPAAYCVSRQRFDRVHEGTLDSWGFAWTFAIHVNDGVSVIPTRNLITNIGFDSEATHTKRPAREGDVPTYPLDRPLRHPASTTPEEDFEHAVFKKHFPLGRRVVATLPPPAQERFRAAVYRVAAAIPRPEHRS